MKQTKKALILAAAASMACALCSCSSAATNASRYFTSVNTITNNLFSSGRVSGSANSRASAATAAALPTPTDFTMSEDGTYNFTGVDGAGYYLLYFCAPGTAEDDDSFLYSSEPITSDKGAGTYTGNYLDVLQAAYGEYQARIVAFPAIGDTSTSMSAPVLTEFIAEGEQSTPQLAYFGIPSRIP